ncbi:MAG TPA: branched-chain amino acid ABC transporter permease [Polyangiaceae bacterium]|nr:branched-chain amino acid ABC transporter permease [Polyangiaceae bacterium]
MAFFLETLVGGLLAGILYSMVAIGFVLIYKASGVFNFAQGSMLLFAALTFVSLTERGYSFIAAFILTLAAMVLVAVAIERLLLRPLVARSPITLFMATLGLSYILEGVAQALWGADVHGLDLGVDDVPFDIGSISVSRFDLVAAGTAGLLVLGLALLASRSRLGLSLRAVADDPLAALSLGVRLPAIWRRVWALAGFVGLIAGLFWGSRSGVQFSLSLVVLKAMPVLVIGGFDSITGALVGGLLVGASEKLAEVYVGAVLGGGIENWFPYFLAIASLMLRPAGLFGDRAIERV